MDLEGLDQYTPAPEALERPVWVAREGNAWARIDGTCQPVQADDVAAGRFEITTCVDAEITCGVAITATGEATLDLAWVPP